MSRIGMVNFVIGFGVLFFAAASGGFIAFDLTEGFMRDKALLDTWQSTLLQSSHGHTNLFAMIHILFGLTVVYGRLSHNMQSLQTLGLSLGTLAMGPGMMWRAYSGPSDTLDVTGLVVGIGLSCALLSIFSHFMAISYRLVRS